MIVASLLLIPVAVVFLALGFINGSSSLLIAAIVVSLLIAVALVLAARQAATRQAAAREAERPADPEWSRDSGRLRDPGWEERPGPMPDSPQYSSSAEYSESAAYSPSAQYAESAQYAGGEDSSDPYAGNSAPAETTFAGESALADQVGAATPESTVRERGEGWDAPGAGERADYADSDSAPDYDRAASTIDAARAPESDDPSWRRPAEETRRPAAEARRPAEEDADDPPWRREAGDGRFPAEEARLQAEEARLQGDEEVGDPPWRHPAEESRLQAEETRRPAAESAADESQQADEFGEPDDDDPDDEPLPQSVRPADAVLVARLDAEVLVVDGRPRYHMADCPHLVGRLTEPLPVNEAVELGFSPCGLCRPVDRLVAAVAQH